MKALKLDRGTRAGAVTLDGALRQLLPSFRVVAPGSAPSVVSVAQPSSSPAAPSSSSSLFSAAPSFSATPIAAPVSMLAVPPAVPAIDIPAPAAIAPTPKVIAVPPTPPPVVAPIVPPPRIPSPVIASLFDSLFAEATAPLINSIATSIHTNRAFLERLEAEDLAADAARAAAVATLAEERARDLARQAQLEAQADEMHRRAVVRRVVRRIEEVGRRCIEGRERREEFRREVETYGGSLAASVSGTRGDDELGRTRRPRASGSAQPLDQNRLVLVRHLAFWWSSDPN